MWRMILVTLAFLGFAFWEISGGSDFEPRLLEVERTAATEADPVSAELELLAVPSEPIAPAPLSLVAKSEVVAAPGASKTVRAPSAVTRDTPHDVSLNLGNIGSALSSGISLDVPSEAVVTETFTTLQTEAENVPLADLREITGVRVNMRNGPGLQYQVLRRLNLGQEVEVLDRSSGWLRLRLTSNSQVGWVSGSLVSDAATN